MVRVVSNLLLSESSNAGFCASSTRLQAATRKGGIGSSASWRNDAELAISTLAVFRTARSALSLGFVFPSLIPAPTPLALEEEEDALE